MRTRMYGGVGGRKTKAGGKPTFVFLLPDCAKVLSGCVVLISTNQLLGGVLKTTKSIIIVIIILR